MIELRPATIADIPALSQLAITSFVTKFGHLYCREDLETFKGEVLSEQAIRAELANPLRLYRLAERDGRLAAYCKLGLACGFPDHARGRKVFELKQLYTDPALTGHGIGAALMEWALAEARARGADEIQLSVFSENPGAQRFYARYGFARVADVHYRVGQQLDEEYLFARRL